MPIKTGHTRYLAALVYWEPNGINISHLQSDMSLYAQMLCWRLGLVISFFTLSRESSPTDCGWVCHLQQTWETIQGWSRTNLTPVDYLDARLEQLWFHLCMGFNICTILYPVTRLCCPHTKTAPQVTLLCLADSFKSVSKCLDNKVRVRVDWRLRCRGSRMLKRDR